MLTGFEFRKGSALSKIQFPFYRASTQGFAGWRFADYNEMK